MSRSVLWIVRVIVEEVVSQNGTLLRAQDQSRAKAEGQRAASEQVNA